MKKNYILLTLALGLAASSCQNNGWDDDPYTGYTIWNKTLQEHNVISIQEIQYIYHQPESVCRNYHRQHAARNGYLYR